MKEDPDGVKEPMSPFFVKEKEKEKEKEEEERKWK